MGKKNRPASFWIPRKAIELLMMHGDSFTGRGRITATQICAYLVLASHTDESGMFSTAGLKKVAEATGASKGYSKDRPGQAQKAIDELLAIGASDSKPKRKKTDPPIQGEGFDPSGLKKLIYKADDYTRMTGVSLPEIPGLHEVRYVVNTFGSDRFKNGVWFDRGIIEGTGHFQKPLKRLIGCGDVAARLLLKLHEAQTYTYADFEGVQPYGSLYTQYKTEHYHTGHGFTYWTANHNGDTAYHDISLQVLGLKKLPEDNFNKEKAMSPFWDAVKALKSSGFTTEVLTVFNLGPDNEDAMPMYEITVLNQHGHIAKSDEPYLFLNRMDKIFERAYNRNYLDSAGRHTGYPVISRVGVVPHVAGVTRCRFRPMNWKQVTIKEARDRRKGQHKEWSDELALLEKSLKIGQESKPPELDAPPPGDDFAPSEKPRESMSDLLAAMMERDNACDV